MIHFDESLNGYEEMELAETLSERIGIGGDRES